MTGSIKPSSWTSDRLPLVPVTTRRIALFIVTFCRKLGCAVRPWGGRPPPGPGSRSDRPRPGCRLLHSVAASQGCHPCSARIERGWPRIPGHGNVTVAEAHSAPGGLYHAPGREVSGHGPPLDPVVGQVQDRVHHRPAVMLLRPAA